MPEKTVREMSELERKHYSLAARVFHTTLLGSVLLGLVALLVGLGLYIYALAGQYVGMAFNLSRSAVASVNRIVETQSLADEVMKIYRGLSEEERAETGTDGYRLLFARLKERQDYRMLLGLLRDFYHSSDVNDVYFAVYDPETSAIVYVADPDEREGQICEPGDWEPLEERELTKFLNWDGSGMLYDVGRTEKYGLICTAGVPLSEKGSQNMSFILADVSLSEVVNGIKSFLLQYTVTLLITVLLFGILLTRRIKKTLVKPINDIAEAAQSYVSDKRSGAGTAEHFSSLQIHTGDEIENLSYVMADMERDLTEYVEDLTEITAEKERISTELSLATRIQMDMIPNIFPPFPERSEFDIYAAMDPAREVGGDFYDYFLIDDDHLCLVMADVSGKGIPAALFMMASKIILANNAMVGKSPAEILSSTNAAICSNNREEMFVTVWLGILEISTGKLTAANAGHEYPLLKNAAGRYELLKDKHGFVIGAVDGAVYKEYELHLEPGANLFLYTDGVPEATNAAGELFGMDRLLSALNEEPDAGPEQTLKNVRNAVDGFVKAAEQFDDLTMLCLEYRQSKNEHSERTDTKSPLAHARQNCQDPAERTDFSEPTAVN